MLKWSVLLLVVSIAHAQPRYRPTDAGPWRPWHMTAILSARQARGATAAEVLAWEKRLQELGAIVRRTPAVAQPVGFAAEMWGNLDGYGPAAEGQPAGNKVPLAGALSFGAFPLVEFMRNGKLVNEDMKGGETELLQFSVNQIDSRMFSQTVLEEWSGEDPIGFTQPHTLGTIAGGALTRIDDVMVLVSDRNAGRPLWLPLTLEEALAPVVKQRRGRYEERVRVFEKLKRDFADWRTPAKRAQRRADWRSAAAAMPGQQGQDFLANMEKSEIEIERQQGNTLASGGPEEKGVLEAERALREAEAVLPVAAAACYDRSAKGLGARFRVANGAPATCRPLVKTNWAFFDSARPRSAPQVLMLSGFARCLKKTGSDTLRGGCTINRQLVDSMDWAAVKEWLNR